MYPARTFPATGFVCGSCPRAQAGMALPYAAAAAAATAASLSAVQPAYAGASFSPPYQISVFDPAFYTPETLYTVTPYVGNTISVATPVGWATTTPPTPSSSMPKAQQPSTLAVSSSTSSRTSSLSSSAQSVVPQLAARWPLYASAPPGFNVGACGEACVGGSFSPLAPTGVAAWASLIRRVNMPAAASYGAGIASPFPYTFGTP